MAATLFVLACAAPFVNPPACDVCDLGFVQNQTSCSRCKGTIEPTNNTLTFQTVGMAMGPVTSTEPYVNSTCGCWHGSSSVTLELNQSYVAGMVVQPTETAWVLNMTIEASLDQWTWHPVGNTWTLGSPVDASSLITKVSVAPMTLMFPWIPLARYVRVTVLDWFNAHDDWPVLQAGLLVGTAGSKTQCVPCDPGWFCNGTHQAWCGEGVVGDDGCYPCPKQSTCHEGVATPCEQQVSNNTCYALCQPGYWCPSPGVNLTCPNNTMSGRSATSLEQCVPHSGFYWLEGQVLPCPEDHWCSLGNVVPCVVGKRAPAGSDQPSDCLCDPGYWGWDACSPCLSGCEPGWVLRPCTQLADGRCEACAYRPWAEWNGTGCDFRCRDGTLWDGAQCQPEPGPALAVGARAAVVNTTVVVRWSGVCEDVVVEVRPSTQSVEASCSGVAQRFGVEVDLGSQFSLVQHRQLHGPIPDVRLVHSPWGGYAVLAAVDALAYRWSNQSWTLANASLRVGSGLGPLEVQVRVGHDQINFLLDPATATLVQQEVRWEDSVAVVTGVAPAGAPLYEMAAGCANVPDAAQWLGVQLEVDDPQGLHEFVRRQCGPQPAWLLVPGPRYMDGAFQLVGNTL